MRDTEVYIEMLKSLQRQVTTAINLLQGRDWLIDDRWKSKGNDFDLRIGDFEIRCLNPEKHGLPPRQPNQ